MSLGYALAEPVTFEPFGPVHKDGIGLGSSLGLDGSRHPFLPYPTQWHGLG